MKTTGLGRKRLAVGAAVLAVGGGLALAAAPEGTLGSNGRVQAAPTGVAAAATVTPKPLAAMDECATTFAAHTLDHHTKPTQSPARLFDSNGAGVAAGDLDGNGFADIVLGNLEGPNTVLWNEGGWRFTTQKLLDRSTRAVNLVDVDADGLLDIVTTHRGSGVALFRNLGDRQFKQAPLLGVGAASYSMAWGDLNGDDALDLVTGSYDAELDQRLRSAFLFSDGAGVYAYLRDGERFQATRLAKDSQALVTAMIDSDHDGDLDVIVGNDFAMDDMTWANDGDGALTPANPFPVFPAHTMSLDAGDIDNDGIEELFATDMSPATTSTNVLAAWLPLMATMNELDRPTGPQRIRNMLQVSQADGGYRDVGEKAGVDATGWAWSSRFGDLDNDGHNDLYVVNGMIAFETFPYLDNAEVIEPNLALFNDGSGRFRERDVGLDSRQSGRGSVLVDLDNDGRLDAVVNNLDSPSMAYENQLCSGQAIEFELRQPGTGNTYALGASVELRTGDGVQVRHVRAGGGYLSGSAMSLHFGLVDGASGEVTEAVIRWPDGTTTTIPSPIAATRYVVQREEPNQ